VAGSFTQQDYDAADAAFKGTLSDHCPLSISLTPGAAGPVPADYAAAPGSDASGTAPPAAGGAPADAAPTRPIKGNINSEGKRLYHSPSCPSYEETLIDEAAGERWFTTEAEALAAGWKKAGNCP
jgi:hypothetical protein